MESSRTSIGCGSSRSQSQPRSPLSLSLPPPFLISSLCELDEADLAGDNRPLTDAHFDCPSRPFSDRPHVTPSLCVPPRSPALDDCLIGTAIVTVAHCESYNVLPDVASRTRSPLRRVTSIADESILSFSPSSHSPLTSHSNNMQIFVKTLTGKTVSTAPRSRRRPASLPRHACTDPDRTAIRLPDHPRG